MATLILMFLAACSTPATGIEPEPVEPEPVEAPEEAPVQPTGAPLLLSFGKACQEPADGEPADIAAVESALTAAGIKAKVRQGIACTTCDTCPRLVAEVKTSADEAAVRAVFAPPMEVPEDGNLVINVGLKCEQPLDGAPMTTEEVLAAFEAAGIAVESHEVRMACDACGCPQLSLGIKVAPEAGENAMKLAAGWAPEKKATPSLPVAPKPGELKGSLP